MPDMYVGTTLSGKTTLARFNARNVSTRDLVIVRDPVSTTATAGGDWGERAEVYSDDEKFFERLTELIQEGKSAFVFVDEAGDLFDTSHHENAWLATRGRHYGFHVSFIAQRSKMLAPSVRNQCGRIFMFRLAPQDRRDIFIDTGHDYREIEFPEGEKGDFLILRTDRDAYLRGNVFKMMGVKPPE